MAFTRKIVDSTIERQIILAMILSKKYLAQVVGAIKDSEFECFVNDYARTVARWVVDYYEQYKKAPEFEIERIYAINKPSLNKEEAELISSFLTRLSNEYVEGQTINEDYIFDNTKEYFERRNLVLKANKVLSLVDMNNVPEAKMIFEKKTLLGKSQGRQSVFTWDAFSNAYDNHTSTVFTLPGALGNMIGDVQRGWLIGILGAFKRGKSFTMQEFALAALTQRKRVVFYSLEMSMGDLHKRFYNRITGGGEDGGIFFFPVFDCLKNQTGVCTSPLRKNQITLRNSTKDELKYIPEYSPCEVCRKDNPKDFIAETYFKKIELKKKTHKKLFKEIQSFETMYGDNIQFQVYPRFAASVDDIREDLDMLENQDDFIPDVICIAEGSLVLTDQGLVPIEKVTIDHRLWDGENWVTHEGIVYKGIKEVITYDGLTATPEHIVHTEDGWRTLESCRRLGLRITKTAENGRNIRLGENNLSNSEIQTLPNKIKNRSSKERQKGICLCTMSELWKGKMDNVWEFAAGNCKRLSCMFTTKKVSFMVVQKDGVQTKDVPKSQSCKLETLWSAWNRISFLLYNGGLFMDCRKLRTSKQIFGDRQNRQQWPLRKREYLLVHPCTEYGAYYKESNYSETASFPTSLSASVLFGQHIKMLFWKVKHVFQRNSSSVGEEIGGERKQRVCKKPVWDILNAGPFHRFTVQGCLVHNCVDYADILKPGRSLYKGEPRHAIDDIWKNLAGLAAERHCVVITASQGNRGSLKKYQMEGSDLAEWIGKLAHVDVFLALNQTPEEKDIGVIRFNVLAHRHKEFNPLDEVIVLQHMKTGQAHLDSEYAPRSYKKKQD